MSKEQLAFWKAQTVTKEDCPICDTPAGTNLEKVCDVGYTSELNPTCVAIARVHRTCLIAAGRPLAASIILKAVIQRTAQELGRMADGITQLTRKQQTITKLLIEHASLQSLADITDKWSSGEEE